MHDFLLITLVPPLPPRRNPIDELVKASGRKAYLIALAAGISPAALCRYRKGLRTPHTPHALSLAAALGVSAEELMRAA